MIPGDNEIVIIEYKLKFAMAIKQNKQGHYVIDKPDTMTSVAGRVTSSIDGGIL